MSKSWSNVLEAKQSWASLGESTELLTPTAPTSGSSRKFLVDTPFKRDTPPLNHLQLNALVKEKLGHQFEIPGHFREQEGQFLNRAFSVNGTMLYAQSSQRQPTVAATSPNKVVLTHNDVPDHGAFPLARLTPGEKLIDKNQIFDLPAMRPFPFVEVADALNLGESFIAAAQTSARISDLLKELGQGSTKIILATSGQPYQDKSLGDSVLPTVYVNGPVDVDPTFVPSTTGMGGHFAVMPKVKEGVTLYMPHSDSSYLPEQIEFALNLVRQALSGQRLNPKAATQGLKATLKTAVD